jgi:putative membrane protein
MAGMYLLIRVLISAAALFVAVALVPGIELRAGTATSKIVTLIVVALIFGVVNAVLKPIIKTIGCIFYVLTLGLIGLVVNGLLLWLTSWVAGKLSLPFHITGFPPAFWGAIIVGLVGWLLNLLVGNDRWRRRPANLADLQASGLHNCGNVQLSLVSFEGSLQACRRRVIPATCVQGGLRCVAPAVWRR